MCRFNQTMFNRTEILFLLLLCSVLLFPQVSFAADSGTSGTCSWKISENTLTIYPTSGSSCQLDNTSYSGAPWNGRTDIYSIALSKTVKANASAKYMFCGLCNLTSAAGLKNLDVSGVTDMSSMFSGCSSLTNLTGLQSWNVSGVTDMRAMFSGCSSLTNLTGLQSWNVSNVTGMGCMFEDCSSLTNLTGLASWNVSNVTGMGCMFEDCSSLTNLTGLASWNVSNVTSMSSMFRGCSSLTNLTGLQSWNVSNVTYMGYMFLECESLINIVALRSWNVINVTNMSFMFDRTSLTDATALQSWNVSSVTDFSYMFQCLPVSCSDFSGWPIKKSANRSGMCESTGEVIPVVYPLANGVMIWWDAVSGAESYTVQQSVTSASSGFSNVKTLSGTECTLSGLTAGKTYWFRVKNNTNNTTGPAVFAAVGLPVSGLKATAGSARVTLSWNTVSGATDYVVQQSASRSSGFKTVKTVRVNQVTVTGLKPGQRYYFRVKAKNMYDSGSYSTVVSATPIVGTPSGVKAVSSGPDRITLSWKAVSGAASYVVQQSTSKSSGFKTVKTLSSASVTIKKLKYGQRYYFRVQAKCDTGSGSYSSVVSAVPVLGTPAGVKADAGAQQVTLSWKKVTGAKSYVVQQSTSKSSGFKTVQTVNGTSVSVTGLTAGKCYYFRVRAKCSSGNSEYSAVVSATALLPAPASVKASVGAGQITLSWRAVGGATKYVVQQSTAKNSGYETVKTVSGTSLNVSGLTGGTRYYFRVKAKNSSVSGAYSKPVSAVPTMGTPQNLKAAGSEGRVTLSWTKVSGAKSYVIQQSTSKTSGFETMATVKTTKAVMTGLKGNQRYYFRVQAKGSAGKSSFSAAVSAVSKSGLSKAPIIRAVADVGSVSLSWSSVGTADKYVLQQASSKTSEFKTIKTLETTSCSVFDLKPGKRYYFRVQAQEGSERGPFSNVVSAVPELGCPYSVTATAGIGSAVLQWSTVKYADSYLIEKADSYSGTYKKVLTMVGNKANYVEIQGLKPGKEVYFRVWAVKDSFFSYRGETVSVTPLYSSASALAAGEKEEIREYSEDGTSCTLREKVCTETECTVTTKVCQVIGDLLACGKPTITTDPVIIEPVSAAEITEECSEDGSSCTVTEKVCTDTECTITSKVCVVVGGQKACADPVVTIVPMLTETPAVEVTPMAAATETPAAAVPNAEVTEECSEDGSCCTITEKVCADTECTITSKVCVVVGDQKACAEPVVTVVPVVTETPEVTEEAPAEPEVTEEAPAEPAVTEEAPAEPAVTEESPAEPEATEEAPAEPEVTEEAPAVPAVTEEAPAEPAVTEEVPAEPEATEEASAEPAVTEESPAEPEATEEAPAEPAVTEEVPAEPEATEEASAEPAVTEEAPAEPAVTEESPAEPVATEEVPAQAVELDEAPAEPAATEDLTIREIDIADLTDNTITFNAKESYVIAPEKLQVVPEAADWADLSFKLDDESIAAFKSTDIEVIKAEGLTINGLVSGSTTLLVQAGEVEKTVTLVISLSEADIQTTLEAEAAAAEPALEEAAAE